MKSTPSTQVNQSIIDGMSVLQSLAVATGPVGGAELAKTLQMEPTKVNRLLKTLASIGITQQTTGRKYQPGPGMHVLATQALYASGLLRNSLQELEALSYYGRNVALGVLWNHSVSFLYHARPGMASSEAIGRIGLKEATTSGIGMVLLADLSDEQVIALYHDQDIPGFGRDLDKLLRQLAEIRKQGYARVQVTPELPIANSKPSHTIAVAVGQPVGSAIALSGWISPHDTAEIVQELNKAKKSIEAKL